MWSGENCTAFPDFTVDNGRLCRPGFDINVAGVLGQDLDVAGLGGELVGVDKHAPAVVVAPKLVRQRFRVVKRALGHRDVGRPGTLLAVILEPLESTAPTRAREEGQLPASNNLQRGIPDLKLAAAAAVVPASTKTQVGAAAADVLGDGAVAGAVEHAAVAEVGAAGDDKQGAGRGPGLLEQGGFGEGVHGVVGAEEAAEGVDAVPDRLDG